MVLAKMAQIMAVSPNSSNKYSIRTLGKAHAIVAKIEFGVITSDECIAQNPQRIWTGGH